MKNIVALSLTFGTILCVAMPTAALADCSSEDRIALAEMGYSEAQIDQQCSSGQNAFAPPPTYGSATTCATQWGSCPLSQPGQPGAGCWCPSPYGPIPGVAQ